MLTQRTSEPAHRRLNVIGLSIACAVFMSLPAHAGERGRADANWIGPWDGAWSVAGNWDVNTVPNGADWNVFIDSDGAGDYLAHVNNSYTVGTLFMGLDDLLYIDNWKALYVAGSVTNNGLISVNSIGNSTYFYLTGSLVTVSGSGELLLNDHTESRIHASTWTYRLTNTGGHTIRGGGQFGANSLLLTNESLIRADMTTPLTIDLAGNADYPSYNTGTMEAVDGATLFLKSTGYLDNTGGVIQALDGSFVHIGGTNIIGGTLTTAGTGLIQVVSGDGSMNDVLHTGHISVTNWRQLNVTGTLTNDGLVSIDSTGNGTYVYLANGDATLTGTGEVVLNDHTESRIHASTWIYRLTNTGGHTIRGGGQFGANSLLLTNESLIRADMATPMTIDLSGDSADYPSFNTGTMEAVDGATLYLQSTGYLDNTGGVIQALDGSLVNIGGTRIIGGTLTTAGTGLMQVVDGNAAFENLLHTGHTSVTNWRQLNVTGTLTNDGLVSIDSTGNGTFLYLANGDATLTGTGEVVLNDHTESRIHASTWTYRLTNTGGHTIRGGGRFGGNSLLLTNESLIRADMTTPLTIDLAGDAAEYPSYNTGTMEAVDGATLYLQSTGYLDNTGGVIQALEGSLVNIGGTRIIGGTLTTAGTGLMQVVDNNAAFENLLHTGHTSVTNWKTLYVIGTLTNDGLISIDTTGNDSYLYLNSGDATLTGTGEVVLNDHNNNRIHAANWTWKLTNGPDHTIRGGGQMGANSMGFINQGAIIADMPTALTIDASDTGFVNEGLLHVTADGYMDINPGPFTTSGTVQIDATRTLHRDGNFTQTGGMTTVEGTLEVASGVIDFQAGELNGSGLVKGSVTSTGTVAPGLSVGELTIQGDYTQPKLGVLHIEVAGTADGEYDVLTIDGEASVSGTIIIEPIDGFEPMIGDEFTILTTTGALSGTGICRPPYMFTYLDQAIIATMIDEPLAADLNCDGMVDIDDLFMVLGAWGPCPDPPHGCREDIDESGQVDIDDLFAVLANWT